MPPRAHNSGCRIPISCVVAQATSATSVALAIPANCKEIVVVGATVKHYLATGSNAALDAAATNSAVLQVGGTETLYQHPSHTHLIVEAVSATGTVDVSYYK